MNKLLYKIKVLAILLFINHISYGQTSIKQYVKSQATQVKHIDINQNDFTDLEQLGDAIGEARIVALGEQMHGDGTTFEAKGRIIRYLHEKKGFNLIVFESDFFGLTYGFETIKTKSKDTLNQFIFHNLLGLWSWCKNAKNFFYDYIHQTQSTPTPLILAGMDCQNQSQYSFENLQPKLRDILSKLIESKRDSINVNIILDNLSTTFFNGQKANPYGCENGINALDGLLNEKPLHQLNKEELNIIANVEASFRNILPLLQKKQQYATKHLYRDRQMFDNLMYLLKYKYPNEKAIIWAHNAHIVKSAPAFNDNKDSVLMTGHLLGNKKTNPYTYYAIGVTSYNATSIYTATIESPIHAQKPSKNSFETWVNKKWDYAFVNWRNLPETTFESPPFMMKGSFESTQHMNFNYQWNKVFDGIFFIRNIAGCSTLKYNDVIKE